MKLIDLVKIAWGDVGGNVITGDQAFGQDGNLFPASVVIYDLGFSAVFYVIASEIQDNYDPDASDEDQIIAAVNAAYLLGDEFNRMARRLERSIPK